MEQINSRLKLFLATQILAWTGLLTIFLWRLSAGKATLIHTLLYATFCIGSIAGHYIVLMRKVKYPLVAVPPPMEAHAVPPQNVLGAEAQIVVATDLRGQISYMNPSAARLLGYDAKRPPSFFALFPENELEFAGRGRWLTLGATGMPPGAEQTGALRYFIDYAASTSPSISQESDIRFLKANGELLPALAVFTVVRDPAGSICGLLCVATELGMRLRGERERQRSLSQQNHSLLNAIAEGILGTNLEGRLLLVNPAAAAMLGADETQLTGRLVHEVVHGARRDVTECGESCKIRRYLDADAAQAGEETFFRADGTSFPVEFAATPVIENGRMTGMVVSFRDVSERLALERMKDEFISTVSHELRTPLTSIRGALGLLGSGVMGTMNDKASHLLRIAVSNTDRLVRLINDILDLERMESGRAPLNIRSCDLADLARNAVETMTAMSDAAGVALETSVPTVVLDGDADRILQVLTNLLSNAIKFSPSGSTVRIRVDRATTAHGMVTLKVTDAGRGIPADKLESVFDRFQQVDAADARQKGGTGLGLAICKTIVQQHGGIIWAERNRGSGVTFAMQLPLTHSEAAAETPKAQGEAQQEAKGPSTVLVCDDDPGIRTVVAEQLRQHGYTVVEADRGDQAIAMAEELPLDAILLDLYMPGVSGWETLNRLKQNPKTAQIPIVVMSVLSPSERPQLAGDADAWVQKPFNENLLLNELGRLLHGPEQPTHILLVEDDEDLAQIIIASFERAGVNISHARTRQEAITMCRSQRPDLLILDLSLPDGNGFGVVDWMRRNEAMRTLPVVVYSGHEVSEQEMGQLRLGPTQFLTKAKVLPKDVEALVLTMVRQSRAVKPGSAPAAEEI